MSFPRYPHYKNSGVEWLGEIPAHWAVSELKHIADVSTGMAKGKDHSGRSTIAVPYLRVANVQNGYLDLEDVALMDIPASDLARYSLKSGDVLMNEGGDFDKLGRGCVWNGQIDPCITQNHVFAVRPRSVRSEWLGAITGSDYAQFYFKTRSKQSTNLASISSTNLMELPVVLPPPEEQAVIAAFLARETAKIDTLTAEQERLIELLKEKRQAVIFEAVTKGLNPSVPMKPSGIDGLGDVPAHWDVLPLHRVVQEGRRITYGIVQPGEPDPNGRYMVRGQDYSNGWADGDTLFRVSAAVEEPYRRARLQPGDVVITIVGAGVGNIAVVPAWLDGANLTQTTARIAVDPRKANASFVAAVLSGPVGRRSVGLFAKGAAQPGLNIEHVRLFPVPLPPLEEQAAITAVISAATTTLDSLANEAQRAIELLQERRTALISAAVTGQIDVRGIAASVAA